MKRPVKWTLAGLGTVVAIALLLALWAWRAYEADPTYWHVIDASDPQVAATGEAFERWVSTEFTDFHEGEEDAWAITIEAEHANHWLATRLPIWEANQAEFELPEYLHYPMIALTDGRIIIAARIEQEGFDKVVSLAYRPRNGDNGIVELAADGIAVGRLWLPVDAALRRLTESENLSEEDRGQLQATIDQWRTIALSFDLGDGRWAQVTQLTVAEGDMTAICRTVRDVRD